MILPDFSGRLVCVASALATALLLSTGQAASAQGTNLAKCTGLWFSTSEDFLSQGPRLPGGPVVSDGDLLSYEIGGGTTLCARNEELLRVFDTNRYDHGLDALDKIEINQEVVFAAFSTEIDSVNGAGQFTAGDLLFTNGAVVPNNALLVRFDLPRSLNLGLDAVHIEGAPNEKRELLAKLDSTDVDQLRDNPGLLIEISGRHEYRHPVLDRRHTPRGAEAAISGWGSAFGQERDDCAVQQRPLAASAFGAAG